MTAAFTGYAQDMGNQFERHPVPAVDLSEEDLLRELAHVHATRHETFLHGSTQALVVHSERQRALEEEYLRRHPEREIDPMRLRSGARARRGQD